MRVETEGRPFEVTGLLDRSARLERAPETLGGHDEAARGGEAVGLGPALEGGLAAYPTGRLVGAGRQWEEAQIGRPIQVQR